MGLLDMFTPEMLRDLGLLSSGANAPSKAEYSTQPSIMNGGYLTKLEPLQEMAFKGWVDKNSVPFDPSPSADYDMRGFYKAMQNGDSNAQTSINANDGRMHFTDTFKTPYHESFSAESKWAAAGAPRWNELDQLELPSGKIAFDERKKYK